MRENHIWELLIIFALPAKIQNHFHRMSTLTTIWMHLAESVFLVLFNPSRINV